MHAVETIKVDTKRETDVLEGNVGSNLHLHVAYRLGDVDYIPIIQTAFIPEYAWRVVESHHGLRKRCDKDLVFIGDIEPLKHPKEIDQRPTCSMVWLETLNVGVSGRQDIFHFWGSSAARVIVCTARIEDGEFRSGTRFSPLDVEQSQLPRQMVECRTQMESDFPSQDAPLDVGELVDFNAKLIVGRLRVILTNHGYGLQLEELSDGRIEKVEMFLCAVEFQPDAIQGVHTPHSMYTKD